MTPTGITGHTKLVTLIGKPAFHSKSPALHSLAWKNAGIDAVFLSFELEPESLETVVKAFREIDGWFSSAVTMPFKQAIIPYLDKLNDTARLAGACNLVVKENGALVGYNSDGPGFMANLAKEGFEAKGSKMVLIGPGGAGSAVLVQAALDGVASIDVFAREGGKSYEGAKQLIQNLEKETDCKIRLLPLEDKDTLKASIDAADILVNCTNVGMGEGNTESPVDPSLIKPGMVVADAINTPRETQLLKDAAAKGCKTIDGIGMLDQQAVVADRIRWNIEIPIEELRAELS